MSLKRKANIPFIWVTPAGMKIRFGLGKVKNKRAGKGLIKTGSGIQINIKGKTDIDVAKSVTALIPKFVHSLDANCIHELTFDLFTILKFNIKIVNENKQSFMSERDENNILNMVIRILLL
jgi:DNA-directed RNA polymerase